MVAEIKRSIRERRKPSADELDLELECKAAARELETLEEFYHPQSGAAIG